MIKVDISRCTGCRLCESACALGRAHALNRKKSRIRVERSYEISLAHPALCVLCRERYCMDCPSRAMTLGPHGQVLVSANDCTLCGKCEDNCPVGALEIFAGIVHVCDLCGGSPKCVAACPENALAFLPNETGLISLSGFKQKKNRLTPAERRQLFIHEQILNFRELWRNQRDK